MNTFFGKVLIVIIAFTFPCLLSAQITSTDIQTQAHDDADVHIIDSLLVEYGLHETIDEIPNTLGSQFEQNPIGIQESLNDMILEAFDDSFKPDSMQKTVINTIKQGYQAGLADTAWHWFQKESTQKVLKIRREFNSLQGYRKQVVGMYEMEQNPPSEIRIMLVESLREAKNTTQFITDSYGIIFRSFLQSIDTLSLRHNFTEDQMDSFVSNYKTQIRSEVKSSVKDDYLVTYHQISQDSLNTYIAFWETEAGIWFNKAYQEGLLTAYRKAAEQFITNVTNKARSSR